MARPKSTEKRDRQINLALTRREYDRVAGDAQRLGQRVVDYARAALLRRQIIVDTVAALSFNDRLILEQLKRMGANLNQAVRQLNAFGHALPVDLEPALREIRALVARMMHHDHLPR